MKKISSIIIICVLIFSIFGFFRSRAIKSDENKIFLKDVFVVLSYIQDVKNFSQGDYSHLGINDQILIKKEILGEAVWSLDRIHMDENQLYKLEFISDIKNGTEGLKKSYELMQDFLNQDTDTLGPTARKREKSYKDIFSSIRLFFNNQDLYLNTEDKKIVLDDLESNFPDLESEKYKNFLESEGEGGYWYHSLREIESFLKM